MNIIESEIHKNFDKNDIHMYLNVGLRNEATNTEHWRVTAVMEIDKKYFNL